MSNDNSLVDYELFGEIAHINLNRPDRLNAVIPQLVEELYQALERAERNGVRAVILSGRGRSFCAGHDLRSDEQANDEFELRRRIQRTQDITRKIRQAPFPVIAAVHGYALGAGCEFALCCDLIIAEKKAEFGFPEVSVGLSVTGGISHILPMTVGMAKAKELLLLGERFTAEEAKDLGLINFVVDSADLQQKAMELAVKLSRLPQVSLSRAKYAINSGSQSTIENAYEVEIEHVLLTTKSEDAKSSSERFKKRNK
jgi:2-(1,2-epoxy-1,2-dihydrophenyl)acetyl-CoA isomerase